MVASHINFTLLDITPVPQEMLTVKISKSGQPKGIGIYYIFQ